VVSSIVNNINPRNGKEKVYNKLAINNRVSKGAMVMLYDI